MEKETLIKFMTNLIALAKVYKDVLQKLDDKEYNTHIAFYSLSGLIETFLKDCQEATKPLLESLKAEIEKDVK
jgi:hypothetical protein